MFGVLVGRARNGTTQHLKAFSGQFTEEWECPGWAGPVAGLINQDQVQPLVEPC